MPWSILCEGTQKGEEHHTFVNFIHRYFKCHDCLEVSGLDSQWQDITVPVISTRSVRRKIGTEKMSSAIGSGGFPPYPLSPLHCQRYRFKVGWWLNLLLHWIFSISSSCMSVPLGLSGHSLHLSLQPKASMVEPPLRNIRSHRPVHSAG